VNPKVKLEKNTEYPFVDMGSVEPTRRYVSCGDYRVFNSGGAKFLPGDTLFARITPCLENGKIAQYKCSENTPAFGSTEFFVFRARTGVSDPSYVYYLSLSDLVRGPAEKSMSGASGRQRASLQSIVDIQLPAPPLPTQRKIAAILSAYDDLIENNLRRIKILEEMAQNLYREWFVKFRFPGYEKVKFVDSPLGMIPEGWEVKRLQEVLTLKYGKALKKDARAGGAIPVYGSSGIVGYHDTPLTNGPGIVVGRKGNVGSVFWSEKDFFVIDTAYYVESEMPLLFLYYDLQGKNFLNNDAAVPGLSRNQAYSLETVVPSPGILNAFSEYASSLVDGIHNLSKKNGALRNTRDLLLPKLISGEVDVSDLNIEVPEEATE
jgi:type I restriction enzyme S subunit